MNERIQTHKLPMDFALKTFLFLFGSLGWLFTLYNLVIVAMASPTRDPFIAPSQTIVPGMAFILASAASGFFLWPAIQLVTEKRITLLAHRVTLAALALGAFGFLVVFLALVNKNVLSADLVSVGIALFLFLFCLAYIFFTFLWWTETVNRLVIPSGDGHRGPRAAHADENHSLDVIPPPPRPARVDPPGRISILDRNLDVLLFFWGLATGILSVFSLLVVSYWVPDGSGISVPKSAVIPIGLAVFLGGGSILYGWPAVELVKRNTLRPLTRRVTQATLFLWSLWLFDRVHCLITHPDVLAPKALIIAGGVLFQFGLAHVLVLAHLWRTERETDNGSGRCPPAVDRMFTVFLLFGGLAAGFAALFSLILGLLAPMEPEPPVFPILALALSGAAFILYGWPALQLVRTQRLTPWAHGVTWMFLALGTLGYFVLFFNSWVLDGFAGWPLPFRPGPLLFLLGLGHLFFTVYLGRDETAKRLVEQGEDEGKSSKMV